MIGEPRRVGAFNQPLELLEMFCVKLVRRTKIDSTVLDDPVLFQIESEDFEWTPAIDHEVFGDDFEPIHVDWFLLENMPIVRHAETNSDFVVRVAVEGVCRHRG